MSSYQTALSRKILMRGDIEEIKTAAERAAPLTNQLLTFSRKQILKVRDIDLNRLIKTTEETLQRLIGENIEPAAVYGKDIWGFF